MADLTAKHTWVLSLSTEELVLIADALQGKLATPTRMEEAERLANQLLSKRREVWTGDAPTAGPAPGPRLPHKGDSRRR